MITETKKEQRRLRLSRKEQPLFPFPEKPYLGCSKQTKGELSKLVD